jgi:hypothetical protein
MPPCAAVWHGGDNGGSTMTGVTATEIRFLYYAAQGNAQVNAILGTQGLAASTAQACAAMKAFTIELNKRWELYGRKLVPINGKGDHAGTAQDGCADFPFYQGQCSLTPPDPPCQRAEADDIASLKPAFVIAITANGALYDELAKQHIIVLGGGNVPHAYHTAAAPYRYDLSMSGDRVARSIADYYCKKLYGKPVQFAGQDVQDPDSNPLTPPPTRKVAIIYPSTNGDPTYATSANLFISLVTGGDCGSKADGVKGYPYQSDINTAQQQSQTTVAALKDAKVTTVVCFCDLIAPVFLTTNADSQGYHPEHLLSGTGLIDYDVIGRLYNPNEWAHAFGPSDLTDAVPFAQTDAVKAWQDAGNTGEPDSTENLNWAYYSALGTAFQVAGPKPTPDSIRAGLFAMAARGGDHLHTLYKYGAPDEYSATRDYREVYWCATKTSPIDGKPGAYISVDGGKRFQDGQAPGGDAKVFPSAVCSA